MSSDPVIAVCFTVLNAVKEARQLLDDLENQDCGPITISAVDGYSTDGTWELLQAAAQTSRHHVLVGQLHGNIAKGRNRAIEQSQADLIVTIDVGVRVPTRWVVLMAQAVSRDRDGWARSAYQPDADITGWHAAISAATTPTMAEFESSKVLPSARGTSFWMESFVMAGGFPEYLDHTEDVIFFAHLRDSLGPPVEVNEAPLTWDARKTLSAFSKQYRNYARGDAVAGIYARRNVGRLAFYIFLLGSLRRPGVAMLLGGTAWAALIKRPFGRLSVHRATRQTSPIERLVRASVIQCVGDISKIYGYFTQRFNLVGRSASGYDANIPVRK